MEKSEIKILIVEDEPIIAEDLSFMLEEMGYEHSTICHDAEIAVKELSSTPYDLALLDINLENETSGIAVAEYLYKNNLAPFLFLTSLSDKSTLDKVKVTKPSGYLVKPIDENDLSVNIELALYSFKDDKVNLPSNNESHIYVKDGHKLVKVAIQDILYLEGSNNYTIIHTSDRKIVLSQTLKLVMHKLASNKFVRVHKSAVVNMDHIDMISDQKVHIKKHEIPIGRTYRSKFMMQLNTL